MRKIFKKSNYLLLAVMLVLGIFWSGHLVLAWDLNFPNPLVASNDTDAQSQAVNLMDIWANILRYLLSLIGVLTFLFALYGGVLWMTASGNADKVDEAKKIFFWAGAGLILTVSSYALLYSIFEILRRTGIWPS